MPRKIPITQKRQWLEAYEQGKSEAAIARNARCDLRTVKKGLEEARNQRVANQARAAMIESALRNHNETLLNLIREILPVVMVPPSNQPVPWDKVKSGSIDIVGGKAQYESLAQPKVTAVRLNVEDKVGWELLAEHLKRDHLGLAFNQWKKEVAAHLEARMVMKQKLATLLKEKAGYELKDKQGDERVVYRASVNNLSSEVIGQLPELPNKDEIENDVTAESNSGEVRYRGVRVLPCAPGRELDSRAAIIATVIALQESEEAKKVLRTFQVVDGVTAKARSAAEEILMLGLLPGQCRICRRLGI